jgi:hypothetical protein
VPEVQHSLIEAPALESRSELQNDRAELVFGHVGLHVVEACSSDDKVVFLTGSPVVEGQITGVVTIRFDETDSAVVTPETLTIPCATKGFDPCRTVRLSPYVSAVEDLLAALAELGQWVDVAGAYRALLVLTHACLLLPSVTPRLSRASFASVGLQPVVRQVRQQ